MSSHRGAGRLFIEEAEEGRREQRWAWQQKRSTTSIFSTFAEQENLQDTSACQDPVVVTYIEIGTDKRLNHSTPDTKNKKTCLENSLSTHQS